jgi:4-aminobutyrate aminotransferase
MTSGSPVTRPRDSPLSPVWGGTRQIDAERGAGSYLYTNGSRYLDFTSGIGVTSTGHCHPRIVDAIHLQAELLLHGQPTLVQSKPLWDLASTLRGLLPEQLSCFFFANSGSEAVESAVKLARQTTGRSNVIAFQGGYHGRTLGALSLTSAKAVYRTGYHPLPSGVFFTPYPSADDQTGPAVASCLDQLQLALSTYSPASETAAVIIEPVLGEGGYVVPPGEFLRGVRVLCDTLDVPLIFDEVQTGFGRTGRMFASEHFGTWPDILVLSKGLGSGMPISCIATSYERMARWHPGSHGGTFGGNPVCAAAALATIDVIRDEHLVENAARMGEYLLRKLLEITRLPMASISTRGLGLMIGCEFTSCGAPSPSQAEDVRHRCWDNGLLLSTCGALDHVIRWAPPLTVTSMEIDAAVAVFEEALSVVTEDTEMARR